MYIPNPTLYIEQVGADEYRAYTMHSNRMIELFDLNKLPLDRMTRYARRHGYDLVVIENGQDKA